MKKFSRILSILLILAMLLSLAPAVFAEEAATATKEELKVASTKREGVEIPAYVTLPADYSDGGSYPLVVMIHGHGGNYNEWGGYDTIANGLADAGIVVVMLDFPGCGASEETFLLNTMTNMKNDVVDVLNYVTANYAIDTNRVGAMGYSMGGRIVLELVAEELYNFAVIELVAPAEDLENVKVFLSKDGTNSKDTMTYEEHKAEAEEKGYTTYTSPFGAQQTLSAEFFADLEKYPDGLAEAAAEKLGYTPVLMHWSSDDWVIDPDVCEAAAEILGAYQLPVYADGHSYCFYGTNEYTKAVGNNGSINWFTMTLTDIDFDAPLWSPMAYVDAAGVVHTNGPDEIVGYFAPAGLAELTLGDYSAYVPCTEDAADVTGPVITAAEGELVFQWDDKNFLVEAGLATVDEKGNLYYNDPTQLPLVFTLDEIADTGDAVIYYTNDVHTYINKDLSYDTIAALKAATVAAGADVLLVDAGDHIQGTAYGSMDKGATIIELMNAAGYDLATLGNHEFDYDMDRILEIIADEAEFPYISANFYHEADGVVGDPVLDAYKVYELGGYKVAMVGITTPETFTKSTPKYFQDDEGNYIYGIAGGEDGTDLYAAVQDAIDAAKAEGVDYVIALGHCGDDPASKPWTSEEVIANTTGLDAFIDGHSHSTVVGKEVADKDGNPVLLTQTGEYFDAIGKMVITEDGITTELLTAVNASDAEVKEIKDGWLAEVDTLLGEKVAVSEVDFKIYGEEGRLIRKQETNLGDYCADALYYLFSETEGLKVDLAIMNGGGIRADMPAGDISYKTTKTVHTFGNVACLITVTGQQILDALEWGAQNVGVGENGGFLQVSGVTYEIHSYIPSTVQKDEKGVWIGGPTGEYRVKNVTIGGEPLELDKEYNLAGYNYTLRDLGDGFAMFNGAVNVKDYVMEDYLVLANYAKSFPEEDGVPTIKADNSVLGANYGDINGDGRIVIVEENTEPVKEEIGVPSTLREDATIPAYVTAPASYDEDGSYPLVVMIHGHGGNHNEWGGYDTISDGLAEEGMVVVTLDFPGCGASTESFQLNTMTNMKNDVLDVLNYMTENYAVDADKVGAFGYSMGGRIVLEMIVEDMYDFATIELVAPGEDTADLKDLFGGAEAWETMKATANENGYVEFTTIYGQHQELSKEWFADLEKYEDALVELAAPKYTGNSLVIYGTQDAAVRPHVSANVAEVMNSAVLKTFDESGHSYSFYGTDPYTCDIVNCGSVSWFVKELLGDYIGYVADIEDNGDVRLTLTEEDLEAAGVKEGDYLTIILEDREYSVFYKKTNGLDKYVNVLDIDEDGNAYIYRLEDGEHDTFAWYFAAQYDNDWHYDWPAEEVPMTVTLELAPTFTDVPEGKWYYSWVSQAAVEGFVTGYPNGTFQPNKNVTRAEFAQMLYAALGSPELPEGLESKFTDVTEGKWYYEPVTILTAAGLIAGRTETTFDPNATITRQEMVAILYRLYTLGYGEDAVKPDMTVLDDFTDSANISAYAKEAFAWAVEVGIISGMGDGTLAPKGNTTRAQACVVMVKCLYV